MNISQRGLDRIKAHEGLRLFAYLDVAGVPTIGYGTTNGVQLGQRITIEQAEAFLRADLAWVERCIADNVSVPLTQSQYDALASLIFNIGAGAFKDSTLLRMLNAGDYEGAAEQFLRWNKARVNGALKVVEGLTTRRSAERAMFEAPSEEPAEASPTEPAEEAHDGYIDQTVVIPEPSPPPYTPPRPDQEPYTQEAPMPIPSVFIGAAIDAIFTAAPKLLDIFKGSSDNAKRNVEATKMLLEVGRAATGAANEQQIVEALQTSPEAVSALREAVEKRWFDIHNAAEKSQALSRDWIKEYSRITDVRLVWLNMTFIELLTFFFAITGMFGGIGLLIWGELDPSLQGAVITLMLIESVVGVRKAWIGNTPTVPPAPKD